MAKNHQGPKSLSEAIEKLESVGSSTAEDFKEILERDYLEIKKALENLKPHLNNLQENVEVEVRKKKTEVESKLKENPWIALGVVGLFAFVVGLFFGHSQNRNKEE